MSRRNALLLFLLLLLMVPLLPPESQFGMLPQILRVPRLYCSDPVFNPLFHFWPFSQKSFLIIALCALLIDPIIEKCLQFRDQRSFDQLRSDPLGICSIVPFNRHQYQSLCSDVKQDKAMKWFCLRFNPYVYYWLQGKKMSTIANILNVDQLGMCVSLGSTLKINISRVWCTLSVKVAQF